MSKLFVIGPRDRPIIKNNDNNLVIMTVSRDNYWGKYLSPFYLGPIKLYDNYQSKNIENAWQFSKVYPGYVDNNNNPTEKYFKWAESGWNNFQAIRYHMGKTAPPLYIYWAGQKLNYLEARQKIYIPLYLQALIDNGGIEKLQEVIKKNNQKDIYLWGFDGYNHKNHNLSLLEVINNSNKSMGHAFVIYGALTGEIFNLLKNNFNNGGTNKPIG